jgi:nicotinamidase-related amidase
VNGAFVTVLRWPSHLAAPIAGAAAARSDSLPNPRGRSRRVGPLEERDVTDLSQSDVFVDLCTQRDYLVPEGARPSTNAGQLVPTLKHLMAYARWAGIPTISCVDVRRPDEVRGVANPDCVLGTPGQEKIRFSLLPQRVIVESDNRLCVPLDLLTQYQQAILSKRHRDPFTNPKLDRLLTEMPMRRFVIFGVSLETSIRLLVLGLLLRKRRVTLVFDACGYWNFTEADMTLRQLAAKGCEIVSTEALIQAALATRKVRRNGRRHRGRSVA